MEATRHIRKLFLVSLLFLFLFLATPTSRAAYRDDVPDFTGVLIDQDTTWHADVAYVFDREIRIVDGAKLTIEPGTHISFKRDQSGSALSFGLFDGQIEAIGTEANPIVFDRASTSDAYYVQFNDASGEQVSVFQSVHFLHGGDIWDVPECPNCGQSFLQKLFINRVFAATQNGIETLRYQWGKLHIEDAVFSDSVFGDVWAYESVRGDYTDEEGNLWPDPAFLYIKNSDFSGESALPALRVVSSSCYDIFPCLRKIIFENNWYASSTGPRGEDNPTGTGKSIIGSINFSGFSTQPIHCLEQCYSNVMFLPGIKGSRLYRDDGTADGDTLWLPTILSNDTEELQMDENGQSLNTVYTKDVLATIPFGSLYGSFFQKLDSLKATGTINDYQSFAYDWRNNVEDIVREGTLYPGNVTRSVVADVQALAESSKSKKVTIIAHSNGGLLAKALMMELEKQGLGDQVDKIIFVGTPQMGTPLAILSLLYGYDEPIPALISQSRARTLAENMPGAYGLLPSEEYFNRMTSPLISFDAEQSRYADFKGAYGNYIDTFAQFSSFLSGSGDGRSDPSDEAIDQENVLRERFLTQAKETHERLDGWIPPSSVEVVQVAGWGLDTVSGVDYTEKSLEKCYYSGTSVPSCANEGQYEAVYDPQFTVDGDGVVVTPSALMLADEDNAKRYWLNLYEYNNNNNPDRKHRDLLEINSVQTLLANIVTHSDSVAALPSFVETVRPSDYGSAKPRLRMALYSPLNIHLYDTHGNHTGPKKVTVDGQEATVFEESIPNSYYYQFGEHKYVGWSEGEDIRVEMDGYDLGAYTLKLKEVKMTAVGEEETAHTTFEDFPTTADTMVRFSVPETGIVDMSPLVADVATDDGVKQYSVVPVLNGVAIYEEKEDRIAPVTTAAVIGTTGTNGWYTSDVTVALVATDEDGGSGVEKTEYSFDGVNWNISTDPFIISQEGTATVQYFSTDKAGNKEETKTATIKIDKTAPEGRIAFNPTTQKLDITGRDILGGVVSVVVIEQPKDMTIANPKMKKLKPWFDRWLKRNKKNLPDMLATITDDAGHTTDITFEKTKDHHGFLFVRVRSLGYDGDEAGLTDAFGQYKWRIDRKNQYRLFVSELRAGEASLESHYIPKKNETWIMEKPREIADDESDDESEHRSVLKRLPGIVVPYLQTEKGSIKIDVL